MEGEQAEPAHRAEGCAGGTTGSPTHATAGESDSGAPPRTTVAVFWDTRTCPPPRPSGSSDTTAGLIASVRVALCEALGRVEIFNAYAPDGTLDGDQRGQLACNAEVRTRPLRAPRMHRQQCCVPAPRAAFVLLCTRRTSSSHSP